MDVFNIPLIGKHSATGYKGAANSEERLNFCVYNLQNGIHCKSIYTANTENGDFIHQQPVVISIAVGRPFNKCRSESFQEDRFQAELILLKGRIQLNILCCMVSSTS